MKEHTTPSSVVPGTPGRHPETDDPERWTADERVQTILRTASTLLGVRSRDVLESLLEDTCRRVVPFDTLLLLEYDADTQTLHEVDGRIADPSRSTVVEPEAGTPAYRVVHERRSVRIVHTDDSSTREGRVTDGVKAESAIWSPVLSDGSLLGILTVQSSKPDLYTAADVKVVETLASLVGAALVNIRTTEERKAAEEALRERERELREAQRLARVGSWTWHVASNRVTWSDELYRIYGLEPRTFGASFEAYLACVHPDDRSHVQAHIEQTLRTGEPFQFEERILRPDGTVRTLRSSGEATLDARGRVTRLVGVCQDITEVKDAERVLRTSEESYRTIFELSSDAIFVHDIETGAILDANRKACEMHGCTLDELKTLGVPGISDGQPPFDAEHAYKYIQAAAQGEPQRFEWLVRKKTGERFWVEVSLHRVNILGEARILASVRNIDERKQAEAALALAREELEQRVTERTAELAQRTAELAQAEQRFRAIVEASPTPLLLSRIEDGIILYANDRLEALIGVEPGSLVGQKTPDFYYDASDRPRVLETIQHHGHIRDLELRIRRADGNPRWVSLSVQRLTYNGEPALATALIDITERKNTETALRESEESYRGLFDNLTELVYIQDLEGHFLNVNEAVVRAYGYSREELVGKTPELLADPERVDLERVMEHFRRAVEGEPQRFDWWGRRKDGCVFPKEVVLKRSTYFGRDVVIAVGRNISDRLNAEAALRRSEEYFRRLIENTSDLITIMDTQGIIRYESPSVTRLLGYERDELIGKNAFDYLAPEDVAPTIERWSRVLEEPGTPVSAEFRFRHKDGSWRYMEAVGTTLSPDSPDEGVVVNSRDISERKHFEEALRRSEEHFRRLTETSYDLIQLVDSEGKIVYTGPSVQRLLGYTPEEIKGSTPLDFLHPEDLPKALDQIQEILNNPGRAYSLEYRVLHKDGSWRWFEAYGRTLSPDSAEHGLVANARDITERVEAERTLRLQKTLLEAQGEASIDGILVVSDKGKILSYNQRFMEMWKIPPEVGASRSDEAAIQSVLDQLQDPEAFLARIDHLYAHPEEKARDEIVLRDGRVFDRYTAPIISSEGDYYGRIWFFRDMTAQKRHADELEQARQEAERSRIEASHYAESLERELEFGRQIQQGLLPASLPEPSGWEIAVRFQPVWQVAGDFYDAFELPTGRIGLIVADVSGKGVGAALFMALFQSLLRSSAERASASRSGSMPSDEEILIEAITATNGYITRVHKRAHMFASAFFGLLDPASGTVRYVNAGHEPPVVFGPERSNVRLRPTGPALGLLADAAFEVGTTTLGPRDMLLAYTDGVTEARNTARAFFAEERLLSLLRPAPSTATGLLDRIEHAVRDFAGAAALADDVTMLAVRRHSVV